MPRTLPVIQPLSQLVYKNINIPLAFSVASHASQTLSHEVLYPSVVNLFESFSKKYAGDKLFLFTSVLRMVLTNVPGQSMHMHWLSSQARRAFGYGRLTLKRTTEQGRLLALTFYEQAGHYFWQFYCFQQMS